MNSDRQIIKSIEDITDIMGEAAVLYDKKGRVLLVSGETESEETAVKGFISGNADREVIGDCLYLRSDSGYILQTRKDAEKTALLCLSAVNNHSSNEKRRKGRAAFFADIFEGRVSTAEIYEKAAGLRLKPDSAWEVFLVDTAGGDREAAEKVLDSMFPESAGHAVVPMDDGLTAVVTSAGSLIPEETEETAKTIADMMNSEAMIRSRVAYGDPAEELNGILTAYEEAVSALKAGRIFFEDATVLSYNSLRTGRLIQKLPTAACRDFLREVFGKGKRMPLDDDTRVTIDVFFDNNLNISETGRKLFLHRNTLVYRLEKIQKETGLDIRKFDDAMILRLALMAEKRLAFENMAET